MYTTLFFAHSGWRWIVLLMLVLTGARFLVGWAHKQTWENFDNQMLRFTRISIYIQVVMGIILYVFGFVALSPGFSIFHVVVVFIGMFFVEKSQGWARRCETDELKFKWAFIGLTIGFALIYIGASYASIY